MRRFGYVCLRLVTPGYAGRLGLTSSAGQTVEARKDAERRGKEWILEWHGRRDGSDKGCRERFGMGDPLIGSPGCTSVPNPISIGDYGGFRCTKPVPKPYQAVPPRWLIECGPVRFLPPEWDFCGDIGDIGDKALFAGVFAFFLR